MLESIGENKIVDDNWLEFPISNGRIPLHNFEEPEG